MRLRPRCHHLPQILRPPPRHAPARPYRLLLHLPHLVVPSHLLQPRTERLSRLLSHLLCLPRVHRECRVRYLALPPFPDLAHFVRLLHVRRLKDRRDYLWTSYGLR